LKAAELTELGWSNLKSIGGNPEHRFIAIEFDSSQFGVLDESTVISSPKAKTDLTACCDRTRSSAGSNRVWIFLFYKLLFLL
jgi:hypothetical protein